MVKHSKRSVKGNKGNIEKLIDVASDVSRATAYVAKDISRSTKKLVRSVKEDVRAVRERDPAARSNAEILLLYSGVHALLAHRVAHKLYEKEHYFAARAISQTARYFTGIEIHPGAKIGKGLMIDHGMGVVIGETAEIGDNCTLYQGVTLGGTGKDTGKRHPTLGNNVMVGCGAKVLGPFKIGDNSKIAANAVVLKEVPSDSTAVGIPAKVVRTGGKRIVDELDQVTMPDPVSLELNALKARIAQLEEILELGESKEAPKQEISDKANDEDTVLADELELDLDDPVIREIFDND